MNLMERPTTGCIYCGGEITSYCFNDGHIVYVFCYEDVQQLVVQIVQYHVMVKDPKYRPLYCASRNYLWGG